MKITKENLDAMDSKRDRRFGSFVWLIVVLVKIMFLGWVAAIVFALQYEIAAEYYLLYGLVNKVVPSFTLILYKIIVTVFVCGVAFVVFASGKKLEKKILADEVEYKITFDEESTAERYLRKIKRRITALNLLFSLIIALLLYFTQFNSTEHMDIMIMCAIACGVIFFVLLHLLCKYGLLRVRYLINPFTSVLIYVFYLVFFGWFIYLVSTAASLMLLELLGGALLMFVVVFAVYTWCSFWK